MRTFQVQHFLSAATSCVAVRKVLLWAVPCLVSFGPDGFDALEDAKKFGHQDVYGN